MVTIHYCQLCAVVFDDGTVQECTNCQAPVQHFVLEVPAVDLIEQDRAERNYRNMIRAIVRALWSGVFDLDQAFDAGLTGMHGVLTFAWNTGLRSVGVLPSEQSPEQRIELQQIINRETSLLFSFLKDIEAANKASGGLLRVQMKRAEKWITRAGDVESRARVTAVSDPKLKWHVNDAKENCATCGKKLRGKVKRSSTWRRRNIFPRRPPNAALV